MPANTKGKGGKHKRRGKGAGEDKQKELILKEAGQEYAQVVKLLGGSILEAKCFDGKTRMCIIRGKMVKRQWIANGDIILIGLREYEDSKADVIGKYNATEARALKQTGEIPNTVETNKEDDDPDEDTFVFEEI